MFYLVSRTPGVSVASICLSEKKLVQNTSTDTHLGLGRNPPPILQRALPQTDSASSLLQPWALQSPRTSVPALSLAPHQT